jgi:hypothetical protein
LKKEPKNFFESGPAVVAGDRISPIIPGVIALLEASRHLWQERIHEPVYHAFDQCVAAICDCVGVCHDSQCAMCPAGRGAAGANDYALDRDTG